MAIEAINIDPHLDDVAAHLRASPQGIGGVIHLTLVGPTGAGKTDFAAAAVSALHYRDPLQGMQRREQMYAHMKLKYATHGGDPPTASTAGANAYALITLPPPPRLIIPFAIALIVSAAVGVLLSNWAMAGLGFGLTGAALLAYLHLVPPGQAQDILLVIKDMAGEQASRSSDRERLSAIAADESKALCAALSQGQGGRQILGGGALSCVLNPFEPVDANNSLPSYVRQILPTAPLLVVHNHARVSSALLDRVENEDVEIDVISWNIEEPKAHRVAALKKGDVRALQEAHPVGDAPGSASSGPRFTLTFDALGESVGTGADVARLKLAMEKEAAFKLQVEGLGQERISGACLVPGVRIIGNALGNAKGAFDLLVDFLRAAVNQASAYSSQPSGTPRVAATPEASRSSAPPGSRPILVRAGIQDRSAAPPPGDVDSGAARRAAGSMGAAPTAEPSDD